MVCALICSLAINWMLKCTRCYSSGIGADSSDEATIRLINTGLRKAAMKALPIIVYTSASKPPGLASDCPICLTEFGEGEKVRVLPKCNHGFHMECIDKWLCSHSSCPMCRQSLNLLGRNKKPRGAPVAQATESNCNAMHVDIEITNSTQAILPRTVTLEITPEVATDVTTSSPLPPSVSENQSSCDPMNNVG
jgi:hypothetical protein